MSTEAKQFMQKLPAADKADLVSEVRQLIAEEKPFPPGYDARKVDDEQFEEDWNKLLKAVRYK